MTNEMNPTRFRIEVGSRARAARSKAGYSQAQAAKKLKLGGSTLSGFETGNAILNFGKMVEMAELYDVPIGYFLQDEGVVPCRQMGEFNMERTKKCIGGYLKHIRNAHKWTQSYVAYVAHVSPTTICHMEKGRRFTLDTFVHVCNALEVFAGDILARCISYDFAGFYDPEAVCVKNWWPE